MRQELSQMEVGGAEESKGGRYGHLGGHTRVNEGHD